MSVSSPSPPPQGAALAMVAAFKELEAEQIAIQSFVQQIFTKHILCAHTYLRPAAKRTSPIPAFWGTPSDHGLRKPKRASGCAGGGKQHPLPLPHRDGWRPSEPAGEEQERGRAARQGEEHVLT